MLKLRGDITALDHSLIVMGYEGVPSDLKPIKTLAPLFEHKELRNLIAAIMRERPDLPTDTLIAAEIISRKGWVEHDAELLNDIRKRVLVCKRKSFSLPVASIL